MDVTMFLFGAMCICVCCLTLAQNCNDLNCKASDGSVCNDQGICDCGVCKCDQPYMGPTCEECPTCPNTCSIFRGCVSCKIFGTGPLGIGDCLHRCEYIANYIPVEKEDFDAMTDDKPLCLFLNEENCQESFRVGGMADGYRDLYVRREMDCNVPLPTTTTTLSVIDVGTVDETTKKDDVTYDKGEKEPAGAASGKITGDGNGAPTNFRLSVSAILVIIANTVMRIVR